MNDHTGREGTRGRPGQGNKKKPNTPKPPKPRQPQHVGEKKLFRVLHTSAHLAGAQRTPQYGPQSA